MTTRDDGDADPGSSARTRTRADGETDATDGDDTDEKRTNEVAVAVDGLRKQFRTGSDAVTAVDGVSFEIEAGAVVGILGPNGAGKTTLIKSVLGMILPDEGAVRISGIDTQDAPREAYAHVDAMLEGARNDYWRLTVRENLRYFATVSGVDPDSVADRHGRLLDRLALTEKADVPVRDLSRGMKQKVSLASVLAGGVDVVFLDEPTLGLDVKSSRTLQRELRRLATEEGLTVVLSSHDMDVVETVCDRVIVMSDGRVVADDAVDALLRSGDDTHCVRITSGDFDRELRAELRDRFDVTAVEQLEPGARVEVTTDSEGLYAVMAYLRTRGVTLKRVETVEPDMEEVFVELTGVDRNNR